MELEITIRVPLGAEDVSVEQRRIDTGASPISPDGGVTPPDAPTEPGSRSGPSDAEAGPPSIEMIERFTSDLASATPPALDEAIAQGIWPPGPDLAAPPDRPDLPDLPDLPDASAEGPAPDAPEQVGGGGTERGSTADRT